MNDINAQNKKFKTTFEQIKNDISKANLEDVELVLGNYYKGQLTIDGFAYNYQVNPILAACINERYKELTGQDHPTFLKEQGKILDSIIKAREGISVNGKPTIYQRLKNNLTKEGLGIDILSSKKNSYIEKFEQIKYGISKASLEDVKNILDHYDQDSILIDGVEYHFRPTILQGASLNARYKELTGQDHPKFLKTQEKLLEEEIKSNQANKVNGKPTIYEQLKNNTMELGNHEHVIIKSSQMMMNPQEASLEDISSLLNYYNGDPVLINGIAYHPFNDPISASKLNSRYKELTGKDHPVFVQQVSKVIDGLMKEKDKLVEIGAYNMSYFDTLKQIQEGIKSSKSVNVEENKKIFDEERNKQRQLDASIRNEQIQAMHQANKNIQGIGEQILETTQDNSIVRISRW